MSKIVTPEETTTQVLSRELPAVPESVRLLRHAVEVAAAPFHPTPSLRYKLSLCASEALSNSVRHAYVDEPFPGCMYVSLGISGRILHMTIGDEGRGVRPRADSPGLGLGLALIADMADTVSLVSGRHGRGAEVRMLFDLDA